MIRQLDPGQLRESRAFFETRPTRFSTVFIVTILICILGFIVWSALFLIDEIVTAKSLLRPIGTISSMKSMISGELLKKNYENGQLIQAGELLWAIDTGSDRLDMENSLRSLERLRNDMSSFKALLVVMKSGTVKKDFYLDYQTSVKIKAWTAELKRQELQIEQNRINLMREKSMPDFMIVEQTIADLERTLNQSCLSLEAWKSNQQIQTELEIDNIRQNLQNMEGRVAELRRSIDNAEVYAPIAGRVDELTKINSGDFIMAGQEILRIIPNGNTAIKAVLYVNPADIARLHEGMTVNMRFNGLPPSDFGQLSATINLIPADISQTASGELFFQVEATIKDASLISKKGEHILLHPGMSAEGRIIIRQNTVLRMIMHQLDFLYE